MYPFGGPPRRVRDVPVGGECLVMLPSVSKKLSLFVKTVLVHVQAGDGPPAGRLTDRTPRPRSVLRLRPASSDLQTSHMLSRGRVDRA